MGPITLSPAALKQFRGDLSTLTNNFKVQYNDGLFDPLNDLRTSMELDTYDVVWTTLKNRISSIIGRITPAEVFAEVSPFASKSAPTYVAATLFEDVFLHLVYKKTFDKSVSDTDFYTITPGTITTEAVITRVDSYEMFRTALSGMINSGNGTKWFTDLALYVIPSATFKLTNIRFTNGGSGINYTLTADDITSRPTATYYQAAPNGFGDSTNGFTTIDDFLKYISEGSVHMGKETEYKEMTVNDFPPLTIAQAVSYTTGLSGNAANYSTIDSSDIDKIVSLTSNNPSSLGIIKDLDNLGSGNSNKIKKSVIYKSKNEVIKLALKSLSPNDLLDYIPTTETDGLAQFLTKPIGNNTTDVYKFSVPVQRIEILSKILGLSVSDVSDLFSGINGVIANFSSVKGLLAAGGADAKALAFDSTLTTSNSANDRTFSSVLSAWRFYRQTGSFDFSKLIDADSIARFLTEDYTNAVVGTGAFNINGMDSANDNRWTAYLTAAKDPVVTKRPSTDVGVIYAALKKMAVLKRIAQVDSNSASSGVTTWLTGNSFTVDRADIPMLDPATSSDAFWGNNRSYIADTDDNVARQLAFYILNPVTSNGQRFNLLENPSNLKYFKDTIKLSVNKDGNQFMYGLGVSVQSSTVVPLVSARGFPILNWGTVTQIIQAVKSLGTVSEKLLLSLDILNVNSNGKIESFSDIIKLAAKYTLGKVINLSDIPTDKSNAALIGVPVGKEVFTKAGNAVNNTNKELTVLAVMIDLAIGPLLDDTGSPANNASDAVLNSKQAQQVNSVLSNTNDVRYKDFLEKYVNLASTAGASSTSADFHTVVFSGLIRHRQFSMIGKYGKTAQWRTAIVKALTDVFDENATLDIATDKNTNSPEEYLLTLTKSNFLKKVSELINYQLYKKIAYVDSSKGPEDPDTLDAYVKDVTNANNGSYTENLTRSIVLGLTVASKEGDSYSINQNEFNLLVDAGMHTEDILNMVVARQTIKGRTIGDVIYYALVKRDEAGEPIFE